MKNINLIVINFIIITCIISCKLLSEKELNENEKKETKTKKNHIIYKDSIFYENIKTVLCKKEDQELSTPIINLNSQEKLLISFDDLGEEKKEYFFTIIHCNSNWSKSDLITSEYIYGFTNEPIIDYEFSFNTIQEYTHYKFEFPNNNMKPIISGNYILQIYEENKIIAQKRFMVLDSKVNLEAKIRKATLAEDRHTKHEIDLVIKHPNLLIHDPFNDIKLIIKQNNLEHSAINNLKPLFIKNNELIYDYEDENTFWGNNEFRHFDITSLRYLSERIKTIEYKNNQNHVFLFQDHKRNLDYYSIIPDINGNFLIKSKEGWNSTIEADYAWVYFSLSADSITYGDLYIIGELSNWRVQEKLKLSFNKQENKYEGRVYLKQGYYNYCYALKDRSTKNTDIAFIEGTHYETKNDYYIYLYHRSVGENYDQFIGFLKSSSKELF